MDSTLAPLVEAARGMLRPGRRTLLGLVGVPGAGKSTLAALLVEGLVGTGVEAEELAVVPMDGFHLADVQLERLRLRDRKGAPETFDDAGYRAMLRRVRDEPGPVYVPGFERDLEQPIAAALVVAATARLVVTEGNYLLLDRPGWREVRGLLDEVWYVEPPADRDARLLARHVASGKTPGQARAWIGRVDEPNARLVAATRSAADRVVRLDAIRQSPQLP